MAKIKKLTVKILLDIVMCLALVLLYKAKVLTLTYHEVVGLGILVVFLIHILLNRKWVVGVGKKLFSPSTPARTKFSYWMTILLVICFIAIVVTGIFFSKILFKGLFGPDYEAPRIWRTLHLWFSAVSLILVGIHVGLYWDTIKGFFRKYITLPQTTTKVVCYVLLAVIVVWGAISIPQTGMTNWLTGQSNRSHGGDRSAATQVEGAAAAEGAEGAESGERSGHGDAALPEAETGSENDGAGNDGADPAVGGASGAEVADGSVGERSGHGDRSAATDDAEATEAAEGDAPAAPAEAAEGQSEGAQTTNARSGKHGANVTLSNTLLVISQFTCIIGLFAAITYWIDRLLKRNKRNKKAAGASEGSKRE